MRVRADPPTALEAVRETTFRETPLSAFLMLARTLPSVVTTRRLSVSPLLRKPILRALLATPGFVELPAPASMIAVGYTGRPWRLVAEPVELGPDEFRRFDQPGYAKVTMHFGATAEPAGALLVTETRIHLTDAAAGRAFARYWSLVRVGSDAIRWEWLRAARRRAGGGA